MTWVDDAGRWEALRKCRHTAGLPGRHIGASLSKSLGSGQGDPVYTGRRCPGDRCNLHAGICLQSSEELGLKTFGQRQTDTWPRKVFTGFPSASTQVGKVMPPGGKKRHKCILLHSVYVNVFCRCCPCLKVRPLLTNLASKRARCIQLHHMGVMICKCYANKLKTFSTKLFVNTNGTQES